MADHIIVIFDRSGSMGDRFQADSEVIRRADDLGQYDTKLIAAQERLINWLRKAQFEVVTIIPFHSDVETSLTASLRNEWNEIENFIRSQRLGGSTNLQAALQVAIKIGMKESEESTDAYVRYLIVTDGLSDTVNEDIELVGKISKRQGVDGILIDPAREKGEDEGEGERHLRRLCVRGSYTSVASLYQLTKALDSQATIYSKEIELRHDYRLAQTRSDETLERLENLSKGLHKQPVLNRKLQPLVSEATNKAHRVKEQLSAISEQMTDQRISPDELSDELTKLISNQSRIEAVIKLMEQCCQQPPRLEISLSRPRLLSKRFSSPFAIRIYPPDQRDEVEVQLKNELREWGLIEKHYDSDLVSGLTVVIKLACSEIKFTPDEVVKKLENAVNATSFTAKPNDTCHPGMHTATLSIIDKETDCEYRSILFEVQIVDFAFDHISRPLVSNLVSGILGIGSLATYMLTLFGQIDVTFGLASGTVAGVLAGFIYNRFQQFYTHQSTIVNKP